MHVRDLLPSCVLVMSFLDADVVTPSSTPMETFIRLGRLKVEDMGEEGLSAPRDLALLYGLRWLAAKGHLARVAGRQVDRVLTSVGATLLVPDDKTGLILCSLAASSLDDGLIDPLQAALRRAEIGSSAVEAVEVRLLDRYAQCRPKGRARGLAPVPSPSFPLARARERVLAVRGGVPRTKEELGSLLFLGGLFLAGQTKEEEDEGAAVRLVHLGCGDLRFSVDRLLALDRWLEGEPNPEIASRVSALWSTIEAERARWRSLAEGVRDRLSPSWPEGFALDPHQLEGIARIESFGFRTLISDDMGLGKGPMALGAVHLCPDAWPLCILAPVSMQGGWRHEIARWIGEDVEILPLDRPSSVAAMGLRRGQRRILLGNWSFPSLHAKAIKDGLLRSIGGVIGDESHALLSVESVRTRAFWELRRPARLRLLLTGTATPNGRMIELWPQLQAVDPDRIPSLREWKDRFCGDEVIYLSRGKGVPAKRVRTYKGRSNLVELAKVRTTIELRRTKAELGAEAGLPDKVRRVFPITLSVADHVRLHAVKEEVRVRLEAKAEAAVERWREEGKSEAFIEPKREAILRSLAVAALGKVALEVGRMKIAHLVPLLEDVLAEGHRPIVFGVNLDVLREAAERFEAVCPGEVRSGVDLQSADARTRLVASWERGDGRILVLSGKYNAGVTLISSACTLFAQRFFIPGTEHQIEDRTNRRGQTRTCEYWYAHAKGTTDDLAAEILTWKERGVAASQGSLAVRALRYLQVQHDPDLPIGEEEVGGEEGIAEEMG